MPAHKLNKKPRTVLKKTSQKKRPAIMKVAIMLVAFVAIISVVVFVGKTSAQVWQEPSQPPASGNIDPPIWNQNAVAQSGNFWITGNGMFNGKVGVGNSSPSALVTLGAVGTLGTLSFAGNTSGVVTVQPAAAAGTWTMVLPATAGVTGQCLNTTTSGTTATLGWGACSGGSGSQTPWTSNINAAGYKLFGNSGTGQSLTLDSNSTDTKGDIYLNPLGGKVGIGNTAPTATLSLGKVGSSLGTLSLAGNTSGTVTVQPAAGAGNWTMTLPPNTGNAGYQLTTDGAGITSWQPSSTSSSQTPWTSNVNAAGYTLIGNTGENQSLTLDSNATALKGPIILNPNGGSVGVGITPTSYTFQVKGSMYASGTVYSNGSAVCQSDGTNCPSGGSPVIAEKFNGKGYFSPYNYCTVTDTGGRFLGLVSNYYDGYSHIYTATKTGSVLIIASGTLNSTANANITIYNDTSGPQGCNGGITSGPIGYSKSYAAGSRFMDYAVTSVTAGSSYNFDLVLAPSSGSAYLTNIQFSVLPF